MSAFEIEIIAGQSKVKIAKIKFENLGLNHNKKEAKNSTY